MKILTKTNIVQDVTEQYLTKVDVLPQNQFLIVDDNGKILNDNCVEMFPQGKYVPTYSELIELKYSTDVDLRGEGNVYLVLRTQEEIDQIEAEQLYQQKYQEHRGLRYLITVNYDYLFSIPQYAGLVVYCQSKSDIQNWTVSETINGVIVNTAYTAVNHIREDHQAIIDADPHFVTEDLNDFKPV